ncbi:MAG: DNA primase [Chitinophagaceae bacterium]|nr:DNA primase [Chitinophagaceae bacterium]
MISQQSIQQILNRIDIIEILGEFIKLKKRGTNYLGLCPFHNEKSPSFTVSPAKEIYKCFGCGKSGNTIGFLMEHEKISYVEALRWLAAKYHVELEETEVSPEVKAIQQVADSLYIVNSFAQKYFSKALLETEHGMDIGLSYLKQRGFQEEIIRKFQLGFSPEEKNAFAREAIANQFNPELLLKSGLVVSRYDEYLDNYRGRIIFPIHNNTGKVSGFGARIIKTNDKAPKYINTPENEIYVKSRILYGSYFARQAIDKNDECLLVEGYTDVISLHQAGIENVVASGGTSLTQDQLRLVKKYTSNLTIIYDGDTAGVKAALRGLDMALEEGLNVKLVLIPDKEDPDSYVNKVGAAAFRDFVAVNKKDFILFQLEVSLKDAGADSSRKAAIVNQIAETISRINKTEDFTKQQDYIRRCSEIMKIEETGLNALVNKFIRERVAKSAQGSFKEPFTVQEATDQMPPETGEDADMLLLLFKDEMQERAVVKALIEFGVKEWNEEKKVADYFFEEMIEEDLFDNKQLYDLILMYKKWYDEGIEPTPRNFLYHEDQQVSRLSVSIMDFPYELSFKWKEEYEMPVATREDMYKEEIISTLGYLKLRKIKRMIAQNQQDLEKETIAEKQLVLIQTHQHLKQLERELLKQAGTVIMR